MKRLFKGEAYRLTGYGIHKETGFARKFFTAKARKTQKEVLYSSYFEIHGAEHASTTT
ncbi:MAG: hypothetical protein LBJ00_04495 [Planctomycetaceae bacterium]|nr:hypothetical protein [Planctomycetaceae bacterium]